MHKNPEEAVRSEQSASLEILSWQGVLCSIFLIFGSHSTDDSLLWRAGVSVDEQFGRLQVLR